MTSTIECGYAQGEHSRRAGAELRVVLGDTRQLTRLADSAEDQLLRKGLADRLRSGLSVLDILFRLADQEAGRGPEKYTELVTNALAHVDAQEWMTLTNLLSPLENRFSLKQPDYRDSPSLRESSAELHLQYCAGCHDTPGQGIERPAYNLSQQADSMSAAEFYARMLIGVRGDRVTGIDNPFSDAELAGLIHLYNSNQ